MTGSQGAVVQDRNQKQAGNPSVRLTGRSETGRVDRTHARTQEMSGVSLPVQTGKGGAGAAD